MQPQEDGLTYTPCFDGLEQEPAPCVSPRSESGHPIRFDLSTFVDQAASGKSLSDDEVRALGLTRRRVGDLQITTVSSEGPEDKKH